MSDVRDAAMSSKAWPFEEARRILKRYKKVGPEKGYVLFETGYGPSGLTDEQHMDGKNAAQAVSWVWPEQLPCPAP